MNRLALGTIIFAVAGFGYYQYLHVPHLLEEATEAALASFTEAVATQDRARVAEVLERHIAEDAAIHIEVTFLSLTQHGARPVAEDFTRQGFLTFMDHVLFPLDRFYYMPQLERFELRPAGDAADIYFLSREWADGRSHYGGVAVGMRFSSETACEAQVTFRERVPAIRTASCRISMRAVPLPEEAHKLRGNPAALQQLLLR